MLQTDDIGVLFATLFAAYGNAWPHKADAIPVWQAKLNGYTKQQIMAAANRAIDEYQDFPPSIGQFLAVLRANTPRITTYLPPAFDQKNHDKALREMERLKNMRPKLLA